MAIHVIPTVADARAAANAWLLDHLPDRFAVGIPVYDAPHEAWRIPVWLAYPGLEPLGPVGELGVDAVSGEVQAQTPLAQTLWARAVRREGGSDVHCMNRQPGCRCGSVPAVLVERCW